MNLHLIKKKKKLEDFASFENTTATTEIYPFQFEKKPRSYALSLLSL